MKTTIAILAILGLITAEAIPEKNLIRLNTSAFEAPTLSDESADSESEEDDDDEDLLQVEGPCVYLDETIDELDYQVDMFSRNFDPRHWKNALNIAEKLGAKA